MRRVVPGLLLCAVLGVALALGQAYAPHRKAHWRVDFVNAENSMGFRAPQEAARIRGEAIDYARQGEIELLRLAGGR